MDLICPTARLVLYPGCHEGKLAVRLQGSSCANQQGNPACGSADSRHRKWTNLNRVRRVPKFFQKELPARWAARARARARATGGVIETIATVLVQLMTTTTSVTLIATPANLAPGSCSSSLASPSPQAAAAAAYEQPKPAPLGVIAFSNTFAADISRCYAIELLWRR